MELEDKIVQGALEELEEKGIKFTMEDLTLRIGISKKTLYQVITSKEDLLEMVIDRTFVDVKRQQKEILEKTELSIKERITKLFSIIPAYADIFDYRKVREIEKSYPKLYQKIQAYLNSDWEKSLALLQEGMDDGIIKKHNLMILKAFLSIIYEKLLDGKFLIQNNVTYEQALHEIIGIFLEGIMEEENGSK